MQFKKFLPTILKNAMQSKGIQPNLGYYKPTGELKDGVEVMEWISEIVEGRWRVFGKHLLSYLNLRQKYDNPQNAYQRARNMLSLGGYEDYKWDQLSNRQKEAVIDALVSGTTIMMLWGGYLLMFGDAGDDDSWKKITNRIINDFSQQYNVLEIMKNVTQNLTPVSGRKYYKGTRAFWDFFLSTTIYHSTGNEDWLTSDGRYEGMAELMRSFPFLSSYRDIQMFLENDESLNVRDYILYRGIN